MSQERALAFIQRVSQDDSLRGKVETLNGNLNSLVALAAETGYDFSADDWNLAATGLASGQLTESDLDSVAGGFIWFEQPQSIINWIGTFTILSGPTGIIGPVDLGK